MDQRSCRIVFSIALALFSANLAAQVPATAGAQQTSESPDDLDALLSTEPTSPGPAPSAAPAASPAPDSAAGKQPTAENLDTIPVATEETAAPAKSNETVARRRSYVVEEIVVTAQKREENLHDVPIAISAFSGDTLSKLGVTDTRDLQRLVPGFNANESGRNTTLFTLRGVGFTDTTYTATNTVGTYIDEVNLPYAVMTRGANLDIQRVEVLKGPQGTLYGRNTTGGLINYVAKSPTEQFEAGTVTSFSRFNTLESENFISGPIFRSSLLGRFAFKVVRAFDGWQISNVRRGDDRLGKQDKLSGRGSLDWKPVESLLVHFRVDGWRDRSDPTAPQAVGIIPGNPFVGENGLNPEIRNYPFLGPDSDPRLADWAITAPFPGKLDDSFLMESAKAVWGITETLNLTTILSHLKQQSDHSPQLQGFHITETDLITTADIQTNALEMRLSDKWWSERFVWSLGFNLSKDRAHEDELAYTENAGALFAVGHVPGGPAPVTDLVDLYGVPTIKQKAAFVNTDTKLSDAITLNLGARYTKNDEHYFFCASEPTNATGVIGLSNVFTLLSAQAATEYTRATGMPGDPRVVMKGQCFSLGENGNNDPFVSDLNESNLSGRVALSWKTESDSLYFASVSRGFKAGGFPVLNPARKAQLKPVVQEQLLAYELGAKLSFLDGQVFTGLGAFYYDYKNKQLLTKTLDGTFGPLPILQNAPKSNVYGFELEARVTPFEGLFVSFAGSYIKTKIEQFMGTNSEGKPQNFAGLPFNFAPEKQFSVVADYTRPVTDAIDLGVGADYYYTSAANGAIDQNPLLAMNAYGLIGARIHLGSNDGKWTASIFGRNLSNENANVGSNSFSEAVTRAVARPRTYGVSVNYLWK